MPDRVQIREVGLRDGLQSIDETLSTKQKIAWIHSEYAAGVREMEVTSFVPPKLVPQLADAADVVSAALSRPDLTVAVLVPNHKGAQRALECGAHKLNYVLSASESHNQANVRRSTKESVADFGRIATMLETVDDRSKPKLCGGISTAFGCTIEGQVSESAVVQLAVDLVARGADELIIADTVGFAGPSQVASMFARLSSEIGEVPLAAHFHDTRGLGLANVMAALESDVRAFDASLGGLGGCPHAPGATGNIVTEDLAFLCASMGLDTGLDLEALIDTRRELQSWLGDAPFAGNLVHAGVPKGFAESGALRA